jgi:hypothetical protein
MACPRCNAPIVEIRLPANLVLHSCSNCEGRFWSREGESADLGDVLASVATASGRRVTASASA